MRLGKGGARPGEPELEEPGGESEGPTLTRCAKVSPGASTSPAAPPNSAAPSPRELGARSRGAARTFCGGCAWGGGGHSASWAAPAAGARSAAGGDSGAREGVAIFPEERVFREPNRTLLKRRNQNTDKEKGRLEERAGAEVTEVGLAPRLGARSPGLALHLSIQKVFALCHCDPDNSHRPCHCGVCK